jgi:hypothetical protein
MNFTRMRKEMEEHISSMLMTSTRLYQVDVTGEERGYKLYQKLIRALEKGEDDQ